MCYGLVFTVRYVAIVAVAVFAASAEAVLNALQCPTPTETDIADMRAVLASLKERKELNALERVVQRSFTTQLSLMHHAHEAHR
jgi:hypothetical protein